MSQPPQPLSAAQTCQPQGPLQASGLIFSVGWVADSFRLNSNITWGLGALFLHPDDSKTLCDLLSKFLYLKFLVFLSLHVLLQSHSRPSNVYELVEGMRTPSVPANLFWIIKAYLAVCRGKC